jgi:hypothetical protein
MIKASALLGRRELLALLLGTTGIGLLAHVVDNERQLQATSTLPTYQAGDSGEQVRTLQYLLRAHDYNLTVTGAFDPATEEAVKSFQQAHGLTPNGKVDGATWAQLLVRISLGSSGDAVLALQRLLEANGYPVTVNATFDARTEAAVSKLQKERGLSVSGAADPATWINLLGGSSGVPGENIIPGKLFNNQFGPKIDPYSPYQMQSSCYGQEQPGMAAFKAMVMEAFPHTRNYGILRACNIGMTSEHKEGRAWDWRVSVDVASEVQSVNQLFAWLFATDQYGNTHAMIRRLGIMYIIWNRRIWSSSRNEEGWRPYTLENPHTDHVHFSLSWPGARQETTFWHPEQSYR